jgi:enoyl-[acyl-carrier protein] reductase I
MPNGANRLYLVTGAANEASIAWAVAAGLLGDNTRCILAAMPRNVRRVEKLVQRSGYSADVLPLDVKEDASLVELAASVRARIGDEGMLAGILHAIAYANMDDLAAGVVDTTRAGFLEALDVSVYSFLALVRHMRPLLGRGASVVALTYHGSQKCIPGYNVMGIAKAALESACRYLAYDVGKDGIRVNCVSPGPLLTLSSSAFPEIEAKLERAGRASPLGVPTQMDDVSATIRYVLSPAAAGITGQCIYVDNGLSGMGL